jgi:hypothetical protein
MRSRMKELEEALATSHNSQSTTIHPLLQPEALRATSRLPTQAEANESRLHTEFDVLMLSEAGKMQCVALFLRRQFH